MAREQCIPCVARAQHESYTQNFSKHNALHALVCKLGCELYRTRYIFAVFSLFHSYNLLDLTHSGQLAILLLGGLSLYARYAFAIFSLFHVPLLPAILS